MVWTYLLDGPPAVSRVAVSKVNHRPELDVLPELQPPANHQPTTSNLSETTLEIKLWWGLCGVLT